MQEQYARQQSPWARFILRAVIVVAFFVGLVLIFRTDDGALGPLIGFILMMPCLLKFVKHGSQSSKR